MNYADEDYVRFYTRDTITWLALGFEGQSVMSLMLHGRFNRSGIFDCGGHDPSHAVTLAIRCPPEIAKVGLQRLLDTKTWVLNDGKIIWPNYVEAQHCKRSDRARKAESRQNLAMEAMGQKSHAVTRRHTPSQPVTPKPKPRPKQKPKPKQAPAVVAELGPKPESESVAVLPPPPPPPEPVPELSLQERAALWVKDPGVASLRYPQPERWPEMVELNSLVGEIFGFPPDVIRTSSDRGCQNVLKRWAEGNDQATMLRAVRGSAKAFIGEKPELQCLKSIFAEPDCVSKYARLAKPLAPVVNVSNRKILSPEAQEILRKRHAGEL